MNGLGREVSERVKHTASTKGFGCSDDGWQKGFIATATEIQSPNTNYHHPGGQFISRIISPEISERGTSDAGLV